MGGFSVSFLNGGKRLLSELPQGSESRLESNLGQNLILNTTTLVIHRFSHCLLRRGAFGITTSLRFLIL